MCREFSCLPAQAIEAIENDVGFTLFKIMDLRAYSRAKEAYDQGQNEPDISKRPSGGMVEVVRDIVFEIANEKIKQFQAENPNGS